MKKRTPTFLILLWLLCGFRLGVAQIQDGRELVHATLVTDVAQVQAGQKFRVGVLYKIEPEWHIYWRYAGDSGIPTQVDWQLPPGFKVGPLQWPSPGRDKEPGDLEVFAYSSEVLLFAEVTAPATLPAGPIPIKADSKWLVCKSSCVPGGASLSLDLNSGTNAAVDPTVFQRFAGYVPQILPAKYQVNISRQAQQVTVAFSGVAPSDTLDFYPDPPSDVVLGHGKQIGKTVTFSVDSEGKPLDRLGGVAVIKDGSKAEAFEVPPQAPTKSGSLPSAQISVQTLDFPTLLQAIGFALIGGLILNVMPCVLPVISLKIFGFVSEAGGRPEKAFRLALAFAGGILACFGLLGLGVIFLRNAGANVGWGFQFQDERFVLIITCVVFAFALNLLGVYEIAVSAGATGGLARLASGQGYAGAFFQGVFATVLATPCTAPFLGTASAFAFAQPPLITFVIFFSVGIGMAAPYLLLAINPKWLAYLPKPGDWMVRIKQVFGFLLLGTVLWLAWVLGQLKGVQEMAVLGALLLLIGIIAWIKGSFWTPVASSRSKWLSAGAIAVVLILGIAGYSFFTAPSKLVWQKFSQESLDAALDSGRPVFVDFTADWCITCKANERFAIDTASVRNAFAQHDVIMLRADWTNGDPAITEILKQHGRAGVPMYLVYPGGKNREPAVLPELITAQTVLDALKPSDALKPG
jgi:thiol:disulfide interchange protein DsbD